MGTNTAVAGVGLGLAVPVNRSTRRIVGALMRDGRVRRGGEELRLELVPEELPT